MNAKSPSAMEVRETNRSIEDLEDEITALAATIQAATFRILVLVEEMDHCWGRIDDGQAVPPAGVVLTSLRAHSSYHCVHREGDPLEICWGDRARNLWRQEQKMDPEPSRDFR
jgi:hypothetical protein